ncbi:MAG: 4-hydroxybenzoate polyprenyltransferase [Gammaproteobacteria bacterium]|jgi:4-hydroxybenzoate polyprenyltransferase
MASTDLPLCIDLDGTLVHTDTFDESVAKALRSPGTVCRLIGELRHGRAKTKAMLAQRCQPDPALLPYNLPLLDFLNEERARGRQVLLVTATNEAVAIRIADHLGVFNDVMASTAQRNIRGAEKGRALVERFSEGGFVYAGNDHTDLKVWSLAGGAIVVDAPPAVVAQVDANTIERTFTRPSQNGRMLDAFGVFHWPKNALALLPLLLLPAGGASEPVTAAIAFAMTAVLCMLFCALYLLKDLVDLEQDRRVHQRALVNEHDTVAAPREGFSAAPAKEKVTPLSAIASAHLPVRSGFVLCAGLGLLALAGCVALGAIWPGIAIIVSSVIYTFFAQHHMLAPLVLAALLVERIAFGATVFAIDIPVYWWALGAVFALVAAVLIRRVWLTIDET